MYKLTAQSIHRLGDLRPSISNQEQLQWPYNTPLLTMGNQLSAPKPGTEFQVIGAGLSRTGTASFSKALRILLDRLVYHGGTQTTLGDKVEMKS
jgi:hypothetical protein